MIIGIDASKAASEKKTGVENFVYQLILHLSKHDQNNSYLLFTNKVLPKELLANNNFKEILIPFPKFWNKFRLPLALLKYRPEVYIQPTHTIPTFAPKKTIAVFHDLAWVKFPKAYSKTERLMQKIALVNIVKKAAKIVCVSSSAQSDLVGYLPTVKEKTLVVHLGSNPDLKQLKNPKDILNVNSNYFLYIGRLEERKNTARIVEAFGKFKAKGHPQKLILIGHPGYGFEKIKDAINDSKHKNDILMPGYMPISNINDILSGADAFVFPSLYEGFGLVVIEAMQAGTPVITSNISSLPEVAGDAALLVNPKKTGEIEKAMETIVTDSKLRENLVSKGLQRARKYSWDTTAKEFLKLMEEL